MNSFGKINELGNMSEKEVAKLLINFLSPLYESKSKNVYDKSQIIIRKAQQTKKIISPIDSLLQEYKLNSKEGTVLLCLAEALLRIPDKKTIDRLLEDKFTSVDWKEHTGFDKGVFVNASSWAFFLTGNILEKNELDKTKLEETYKGFIKKTSEPIFRIAIRKAVMVLANQFVFKPSIEEGIKFTGNSRYKNNLFSFDMLGEGARTQDDAEKYFVDYKNAIQALVTELEQGTTAE